MTTIVLGDDTVSSCDVFDLSSNHAGTRLKRNAEDGLTFMGRNKPVVSNQYYRFAGI